MSVGRTGDSVSKLFTVIMKVYGIDTLFYTDWICTDSKTITGFSSVPDFDHLQNLAAYLPGPVNKIRTGTLYGQYG